MEALIHIIISREIIKPSSKTPNHLKQLKLSYFDQLAPPVYTPLIFFYQANKSKGLTSSNHVQISQQLKQSLSNTLTSFYPLAGRVRDNFFVDCNDAGAEFIEARANGQLMDVIKEPIMDQLKYLPVDTTTGCLVEGPLVVVKITFFDCGGISIGVCISHQIADFVSTIGFINAWAATSRGESEFDHFTFDLANYFPAREFPADSGSGFLSFFMSNEKLVTKKILLDKEKLAVLKHLATSPSGSTVKDPTRVEVVSAFIWKHFIEVAKLNNLEKKKTFASFHTVNMRTRTRSPGLENVFGNCFMWPMASAQNDEGSTFSDLISKLRSAISTINDDYITKAQSEDSTYLNDLSNTFGLIMKGELEWISFSSWCRFPIYEVDYGWGNPVWFCSTALPLKNSIGLVSSKCGDGIEVWVNMSQHKIDALETHIHSLNSTNFTN